MIKLQFSAMDDLGSDAIKVFERGWCSHVDAVLPSGQLLGARSDAVGGQPAGVQVRPAAYLPFAKTRVYGLPCRPAQEMAWADFLVAQVGKPYDKEGIVGIALGRNWRKDDSWFCSELQSAALEASGFFPYKISEAFNFITPRDCELLVSPWAATIDA